MTSSSNRIAMIRATLKYETREELIRGMAPLVSRGGLFIRTRTTRPVGTEVHFEFKLANGLFKLTGEGIVRREIPYDASNPAQTAGMLLGLKRINKQFDSIMKEILEQKATQQVAISDDITPVPEAVKDSQQTQKIGDEDAAKLDHHNTENVKLDDFTVSSAKQDNSLAIRATSMIVETRAEQSSRGFDLFGDMDLDEGLDSLFSSAASGKDDVQQDDNSKSIFDFSSDSVFGGLFDTPVKKPKKIETPPQPTELHTIPHTPQTQTPITPLDPLSKLETPKQEDDASLADSMHFDIGMDSMLDEAFENIDPTSNPAESSIPSLPVVSFAPTPAAELNPLKDNPQNEEKQDIPTATFTPVAFSYDAQNATPSQPQQQLSTPHKPLEPIQSVPNQSETTDLPPIFGKISLSATHAEGFISEEIRQIQESCAENSENPEEILLKSQIIDFDSSEELQPVRELNEDIINNSENIDNLEKNTPITSNLEPNTTPTQNFEENALEPEPPREKHETTEITGDRAAVEVITGNEAVVSVVEEITGEENLIASSPDCGTADYGVVSEVSAITDMRQFRADSGEMTLDPENNETTNNPETQTDALEEIIDSEPAEVLDVVDPELHTTETLDTNAATAPSSDINLEVLDEQNPDDNSEELISIDNNQVSSEISAQKLTTSESTKQTLAEENLHQDIPAKKNTPNDQERNHYENNKTPSILQPLPTLAKPKLPPPPKLPVFNPTKIEKTEKENSQKEDFQTKSTKSEKLDDLIFGPKTESLSTSPLNPSLLNPSSEIPASPPPKSDDLGTLLNRTGNTKNLVDQDLRLLSSNMQTTLPTKQRKSLGDLEPHQDLNKPKKGFLGKLFGK